jgi:hypothetical protein
MTQESGVGMTNRRRIWWSSDAFFQTTLIVSSFFGLSLLTAALLWLPNSGEAESGQVFPALTGIGVVLALCLLLLAVRVRKIRWLRREGVAVTADVTGFSPGGRGRGILCFRYTCDGAVYEQKMAVGNRAGAALQRKGTVDVLIDPGKPNDYVIADGLEAADFAG